MSRHRTTHAILAALAAVAITGLGVDAYGGIISVPGDHSTIQDAIDAAMNGDEIVVAPGTYNEAVDFLGKEITLRSSGGPGVTTIDGTGLNNSVVTFLGGEGPPTLLSGFTITGGTGYVSGSNHWGGGMIIDNGSGPTVSNCSFVGNGSTTTDGGGVFAVCNPCNPLFYNCSFVANTADCAGGFMNDSILTLICCSFSSNIGADGQCGALHNGSAASTVISFTGFCGNVPMAISGPWADAGGNSLTSCGTGCPPPVDCNGNGLDDTIEVERGVSQDQNADGIPDNCQPCLAADINDSGEVNVIDLVRLLLCFGQPAIPGCVREDVNGDGNVNVLDLIELLLAFGQSCP